MTDYRSHERSAGKRRPLLASLILPMLAFILGLAAMGWLLANWSAAAHFLGVDPPAPKVVAARPQAVVPAPAAVEPGEPQTLLIDPEMQRRVGQIEQRIAQIDNQSRAAVGNADRAEGLLVAFAARRALDRGVALGYIEGLLRQRFGETQRQAVATIITASRQPVTLEELQEGLQDVGPDLRGGSREQNWWGAFRSELDGLVTIRKAGTPSTMPDERLRRATQRLEAGQVDVALAEVLRMPGQDKAGAWVADARRYVAARRALDTIETAALLDSRNPPATAGAALNARSPKSARPI
ncbi:MAG: hypothetical protein M3Q15_02885 [Pseudomonadota bacterium]|nr:hypothetical protein [Pseudomonadota bacterium]